MITLRRRGAKWQANIYLVLPDGRRFRERRSAPVTSREGALRWAQGLERERLEELLSGKGGRSEAAPTLAAFAPRFIEDAHADREAPSTIYGKEAALRNHLLPILGALRLDGIGAMEIAELKAKLAAKGLGAKSTNNYLSILTKLLGKAEEWGVIASAPKVKLLWVAKSEFRFLDFDDWRRLVAGARTVSPEADLIVLLGGRAGMRTGEIRALRWEDVDLRRRRIVVQRSEWHGHVDTTKSGRTRIVPLTDELHAALAAYRHLRGDLVLYRAEGRKSGQMMSERCVEKLLERASRVAGISCVTPHVLRHTFCSHLAMQGVPCRTVQEYAGHADLSTTLRYMHLSPGHLETAIRVLEPDAPLSFHGTPVAHVGGENAK